MEIFIKDKEKLIRHLDFQKDKMKDKVHKLDQYLLGKGPLKGANKVLCEKIHKRFSRTWIILN